MKSKKLLSILLLFTMLATTLWSIPASAEEATWTWSIDENGTLTVSGTGEVYVGYNYSYQPWYSVRDSISSIVVEEGITSIKEWCFSGLPYVTSVSFPESLTSIGDYVFNDCIALSNVTLPSKLEKIGHTAFSKTAIKEITIPASVTEISSSAFSYCTNLRKVTFQCTELVELPSCLFEGCSNLKTVILPEKGLKKIQTRCFEDCISLEEITLPESVVYLGMESFEGCSALNTINTDNVLEYDSNVFGGCTSLNTITLNDLVKSLSMSMFLDSGISTIELPENLEIINSSAFDGCKNLKSIVIPDTVKTLGGSAFKGCTALKSIEIPNKITTISSNTFENCTALNNVSWHDNITYIGGYAFKNCASLVNLVLPGNIERISWGVFENTGIKEITVPESLTYVEGDGLGYDGVFKGSALETAYFEEGTTTIINGLFMDAANLKNVDLSNIEKIGDYAFARCSAYVPVITDKTKEIGKYAFYNCTAIDEFEIPAWMETIPDALLAGTNLGYIVFPETVKTIGTESFKNCKRLSYIEFSPSVTDIGVSAFEGCTALDVIDIPGTVINIENNAFLDCTNLAELTMHKGTETIGAAAFKNCALTEVRPSQTIRVLDDSVFGSNPLELLVVPRFCNTYTADWNSLYVSGKMYVSRNVESFATDNYGSSRTIMGVSGSAAETEAISKAGRGYTFEPVDAEITKLTYDINSVDIDLDETYPTTTHVTVLPEMDSGYITFKSSDENVATVDASGYVHGINYGTATITMSSDNGLSDTLIVNVVRPGVGMALSSGYEALSAGGSVLLKASSDISESYTWSSSNESVATVTPYGKVTAVAGGTAVITAKGKETGTSALCVIYVEGENTIPYKLDIDDFVIGCDVSLTETENGGNVIAALYDSNSKLLTAKTYPAAENVRVEFTVLPTVDLTGAQIKVFWWNIESVKPISNFRLVEIE